jgi:ribosomal protein S18 acetylase RimI-like enzyme
MIDSIRLRPERSEDAEFLFRLYASTRTAEMDLAPWSAEEKEGFLRRQFDAQTYHYQTYFPGAAFQIILQEGEPIGRLYVDRAPDQLHIIDIALLPAARGQGIGTALLRDLLEEGEGKGLPARIYVELDNPAQNLYLRLGFEPIKQEGMYCLMERRPGTSVPLS